MIIRGAVTCYRQDQGRESYVDQMAEGDSFGELWLLADQPTVLRFVATRETTIRLIPRVPFTELLDNDGALARKLYKNFTTRLLSKVLTTRKDQGNNKAS